ncbi:taste receptor type 1 member 3 [Microcaecilia unicolor]|uniref:Taste receptor type 1 member 3 n=1 Tax=Microcaecilia unicolor TaxID=1415580 RepID=A0A6P7ZL81_9AMPH|nr:taste receptor type 1 member 3-like [Microcaecilia unicolor]
MSPFTILSIVMVAILQMSAAGLENANINDEVFILPGEYMLGGLFAIHNQANILSTRSRPDLITCKRFNPYGLSCALAMKFAVNEINSASSLLPGVQLGYEIYDTCMDPVVILNSVMRFLRQGNDSDIHVLCNYTEYQTHVMAVIGPSTIEMISTIGKLLSFFHIPQSWFQISHSASSEKLSDRTIFPSLLRMMPSDRGQVQGMIQLMKEFQWNWIAAVGGSDEYGKQGLQQLSRQAAQNGICIAHMSHIPEDSSSRAIQQIIDRIRNAKVNITVLFASHYQASTFLTYVLSAELEMVWIASAGWSLAGGIQQIPGIENIGTVIGFSVKINTIPGFETYVKKMLSLLKEVRQYSLESNANKARKEDWILSEMQEFHTSCASCRDNISMMWDPLMNQLAFNVYIAVYCVAHALHHVLHCSNTKCEKGFNLYPWQLLKEVKKVNFTHNNASFFFDENGNPNAGYEILTWTTGKKGAPVTVIGEYKDKLVITKSLIKWHGKGKEPQSTCSKECLTGQVKIIKGFHFCCFDCDTCPEGTMANITDCIQCPSGQWSEPGSMTCRPPIFSFLYWDQNTVRILLAIMAVLVLLICLICWLFISHWHTPVVQASGGHLNFLMLVSLAALSCSICFFIGEPTDLLCQLQQPSVAITVATCLATFLVKSLRILMAIDLKSLSQTRLHWLLNKGVGLSIICLVLLQVLLSVLYVKTIKMFSEQANMPIKSLNIFLRCTIDPLLALGFMFGYNGFLVLCSFICTLLSEKPSRQYNMARDITFAMLTFIFSWIICIPTHAGAAQEHKSLVQMSVILFSCFGILVATYFPKCYILMFKQELNTSEYFKAYITKNPSKNELQ